MLAFSIIIRAIVTVSTMLTLLGPTIADTVHDDLPLPPEAEPSEPDERDNRPRPNRRERRDASHLDARDTDPVGAGSDRPIPEPASPTAVPTAGPSGSPTDSGDTTIGSRETAVRADGARSTTTQVWFTPRGSTGEGARTDLLGRGPVAPGQDWPPTWPDELTTGPSCEVSCIVWGTAHDNGPGSTVYINVKTTTPVHWFLEVTSEELDYSGTRANYNTMVTRPHASYGYLEPGTTYHATIRVEDAWGNIEEASGSFTTSG